MRLPFSVHAYDFNGPVDKLGIVADAPNYLYR